jgi:DNA-binding Xre family transcriptional regulator
MISYKKLWKMLIDRDMKKKDLARIADLSTYTIQKMNRNENVNTETLTKICKALNCTFDDIIDIID